MKNMLYVALMGVLCGSMMHAAEMYEDSVGPDDRWSENDSEPSSPSSGNKNYYPQMNFDEVEDRANKVYDVINQKIQNQSLTNEARRAVVISEVRKFIADGLTESDVSLLQNSQYRALSEELKTQTDTIADLKNVLNDMQVFLYRSGRSQSSFLTYVEEALNIANNYKYLDNQSEVQKRDAFGVPLSDN